jgi:hypothetical protein
MKDVDLMGTTDIMEISEKLSRFVRANIRYEQNSIAERQRHRDSTTIIDRSTLQARERQSREVSKLIERAMKESHEGEDDMPEGESAVDLACRDPEELVSSTSQCLCAIGFKLTSFSGP